jgi:hypothetical protein
VDVGTFIARRDHPAEHPSSPGHDNFFIWHDAEFQDCLQALFDYGRLEPPKSSEWIPADVHHSNRRHVDVKREAGAANTAKRDDDGVWNFRRIKVAGPGAETLRLERGRREHRSIMTYNINALPGRHGCWQSWRAWFSVRSRCDNLTAQQLLRSPIRGLLQTFKPRLPGCWFDKETRRYSASLDDLLPVPPPFVATASNDAIGSKAGRRQHPLQIVTTLLFFPSILWDGVHLNGPAFCTRQEGRTVTHALAGFLFFAPATSKVR